MAHDGVEMPMNAGLADIVTLTGAALGPVESLLASATARLREQVCQKGRVSATALEENQYGAHALSWLATYVEALGRLHAWAGRLEAEGKFGEMERLILQIGFGEYLAQIKGGIPMSQNETARLADLGVEWPDETAPIATLLARANAPAARARLVALMRENHGRATFGASGLDDELAEFCRLTDALLAAIP